MGHVTQRGYKPRDGNIFNKGRFLGSADNRPEYLVNPSWIFHIAPYVSFFKLDKGWIHYKEYLKMAILFAGGFSTLASASDIDMGSSGIATTNKISAMYWTEKLPYLNNLTLEYGGNNYLATYGFPGVAQPYIRFSGKTNTTGATTQNRALRFYGFTSNGVPKTGQWIMGARVERSLGAASVNGPLVWLYTQKQGDSAVLWAASAATNQPTVYVEVVVDWDLLEAKIYYDGTAVTTIKIDASKKLDNILIGSMYLQVGGAGGFLPSSYPDARMAFYDIYAAHDEPGNPDVTGRLGSIKIFYTRVGVGTDYAGALTSREMEFFSPTIRKGDSVDVIGETLTIPAGSVVVGTVVETSGKRADASVASSLIASLSYDGTPIGSPATRPLTSIGTMMNSTTPWTATTVDPTKVQLKFEVSV